jgi:hypothetical protein
MKNKQMKVSVILAEVLLMFCFTGIAKSQWTPKVSPIKTEWSALVDKDNPLPEYPRPQMVRQDWLNLNGSWEFQSGLAGDRVPQNQTLSGNITVPFCVESTLSGVVKHYDRVWYRRKFTVPSNWDGKRIVLHFGAIDWESEIYINGVSMGIHKGGYDSFSYDITDQLIEGEQQELIVRVYDPTRDYGQPRGKQTTAPGGAMYSSVTGIWQTVWLEPVPEQRIKNIKLIPDVDAGKLYVTVNVENASNKLVTAIVKDGQNTLSTTEGTANITFTVDIPSAKLWSPDSPFLYDIDIKINDGAQVIDAVSSYFGMRKISLEKVGERTKIFLNNKFVFQMGPLDQGYWPEGLYTAPTDDALKADIELTKALGFNLIRKHLKVEPQRWYYWADKLGILVWQDMPSANSYDTPSGVTVDQMAHELEMTRMIQNHINSPSIIMWVLFNEGCGQFDTKGRVDLAQSLDPSRLVNQGSGGMVATPVSAGAVIDAHRYPAPLCEFKPNQASVSGEYGGIVYKVPGHQWGETHSNPDHAFSAQELVSIYSSLAYQVISLKTSGDLSAAIYTQITDLETEINGLLTYDRIPKADINIFRAINQKIINDLEVAQIPVVPTSISEEQSWKYTTVNPGDGWNQPNFNDTNWKNGMAGFGSVGTPGSVNRTVWNTSGSIWLRKQFSFTDLNEDEIEKLALSIHHDDDCHVFINGVRAFSLNGYTSNYMIENIHQEAKKALLINGVNTIAIECIQKGGGQYIDAGIVKLVSSSDTTRACNPKPVNGVDNVNANVTLSWLPGTFSKTHKVYFGTNATLTESDLKFSQGEASCTINNLEQGTVYYWRVDEVNDDGIKKGNVWSFKTEVANSIKSYLKERFNMYPNPLCKKDTSLKFQLKSDIEGIEILDLAGNLLYKQKVNDSLKAEIKVSDLTFDSGIYIVRAKYKGIYNAQQKLLYLQ